MSSAIYTFIFSVTLFLLLWLPLWVSKAFKKLVHVIFGHCEIQRAVGLKGCPDAFRLRMLESSLKKSRSPQLNGVANAMSSKVDDLASTVCDVKHIPLLPDLSKFLWKIVCYNNLVDKVNALKREQFQEERHEAMLVALWNACYPDRDYVRKGNHWKDLGFQGVDPATDFRGMGLLGLNQLCFLSKEQKKINCRLISLSSHSKYGFPFAICGINITALCVRCLENSALKTHMYNIDNNIDLNSFHLAYCCLFEEFVQFWIDSRPENILSFNTVLAKFEAMVNDRLNTNHEAVLCNSD